MAKLVYEERMELSGFSISETRRGWLVEQWSRVQGTKTGARWHVPFSVEFPKGTDLNQRFNPYTRAADRLYTKARDTGKLLRKAWIVR